MFKFLKEALNELNAPVAPPASGTQRNASPLRQSFSIDPTGSNSAGGAGRRSSSFSSTTGPAYAARGSISGPGGQGRPSFGANSASGLAGRPVVREKSQRELNREEMDELKGTEEDKLVEGLVKELKRMLKLDGPMKSGPFAEDIEDVIAVLEKLHVQLVLHVPAAQGIFRLSSGFPVLKRILRRLGSYASGTSASEPESESESESDDDDEEDDASGAVGRRGSGPSERGRTRMALPHTASGLGYSVRRDTIVEGDEQTSEASRGRRSDGDSLVIVESAEGDGGITRLAFPEPAQELGSDDVKVDSSDISAAVGTGKKSESLDVQSATPKPMDPSRKFLAIKLCFYVLDAAVANEANRRYFNDDDGWKGFGPVIRAVADLANRPEAVPDREAGKVERDSKSPEASSDRESLPNTKVLGILFSTAFGRDDSLLGVFDRYLLESGEKTEALPVWPQALPISPSLNLTHPGLLPIIFTLLPLPYWTESPGGDHRAGAEGTSKATSFMTSRQVVLEQVVWRIILVALQSSWVNLFHFQTYLPTALDGILDRLYPPAAVVRPAWSIPPIAGADQRSSFDDDAWISGQEATTVPVYGSNSASSGSRYASSANLADKRTFDDTGNPRGFDYREKAEQPLRAILLRVLKRCVEAGVPPQYAHKLFRLAKSNTAVRPTSSSLPMAEADQTTESRPGLKRKWPIREPSLHLKLDDKLEASSSPRTGTGEELDGDVLEIIRHGITKRWPDMFCFSPQVGGSAGGLFMSELGRPWPPPQKGYHFMTWLYVDQLSQPITLLHIYDAKRTVLRIRLLPTSQISVLSASQDVTGEQEIAEQVFSDQGALVPHRRWVHLGIGCRQGNLHSGLPNVKLLINGKRVGAMTCVYPQVTNKAEPRVIVGKDGRHVREQDRVSYRSFERSTFFLGPCALLGDYLPDDLALLIHHLGPRYQSNFQEPLGRFLTYEAATALNIYLSAMAVIPSDKSRPVLPTNSYLIKGIREGKLIPEESIIFSFSASNAVQVQRRRQRGGVNGPRSQRKVYNAALPALVKAADAVNGSAAIGGDVFSHQPTSLDDAMSIVGGPIVALRMAELSTTSLHLLETITILWEGVRESWSASEDMERMRGFDLLAGILKLKMRELVDIDVAKAIFGTLGIDLARPERATIHNSAAYKSLTRFDLWSYASKDVFALYLQQYRLLFRSRHKKFNVLRYFKKGGLVRRILFALRAELIEPGTLPDSLDILQIALCENWSVDDAIKPLLAYLVAALCVGERQMTRRHNSAAQSTAAAVLAAVVIVVEDPMRLSKLTGSVPLHRVIIVLLSCEPSSEVVFSCLKLTLLCIESSSTSFIKKMEGEGGFALLGRVLPDHWNQSIGATGQSGHGTPCAVKRKLSRQLRAVLQILVGNDGDAPQLACPPMLSCIFEAMERLLQVPVEENDMPPSPGSLASRSIGSRSHLSISALVPSPSNSLGNDDALACLLRSITGSYQFSAAFRRCFDTSRLERLVPSIAEFLSISANLAVGQSLSSARQEMLRLMELLLERDELSSLLRSQLAALVMQIRLTDTAIFSPLSENGSESSAPFENVMSTSSSNLSLTNASEASTIGRLIGRPRTADRQPSDRWPTARAKSIFHRRAPLRRLLTGEGTLSEKRDKLYMWKDSIVTAEAERFLKTNLEIEEFWARISMRDWPRQFAVVDSEASLWPTATEEPLWRLDGTEGSMRKRLKLERAAINTADKSSSFHPKAHRNAIPRPDELSSAISRITSPMEEDPFAFAMNAASTSSKPALPLIVEGDGQSYQTTSELASLVTVPAMPGSEEEGLGVIATDKVDKHRRIAQTLQAGDIVEEAFNISRVVGVDSAPGLLIIGRKNLYLIDGLAQNKSGEIVSSHEASKDLFTIPSGTLAELDASELQSHRWSYADIVENNKRSFLFRDVAVEFFFADKRNFLCVFSTQKERQTVLQSIAGKLDPNAVKRSALGAFVTNTVAKAIDRAAIEVEAMTTRWQRREISNFAYLQAVNQMANRTPNDVTQYPVFPWVLQDYHSRSLDLQLPSSFRDLTLPMGALTPERRAAATERYQQTQMIGETPFQFGTHFSSSMIVCSFNIRISPFTEMFLALQGGTFDLADRLFSSIPQAWNSASKDSRGDVRELVPEFFYSPLFLRNINHHDFGRKQLSGDSVDDVALPPWACENPLLFIHRHREALESDWVSRHLPAWIDLTFGYKQHDPAAFTCFHPLSYKDAIDLDSIQDEGEKAASVGIIHNFGQTPSKIFKEPHPQRYLFGRTTLPIDQKFGVDEHWLLLIRGARPLLESSLPLVSIFPPASGDLPPQALPHGRIPFAQLVTSTLRFGFHDQSLRAFHGATKLVWQSESTPVAHAAFVSHVSLATASPHGVITIWKVQQAGAPYLNDGSKLLAETILRGHSQGIQCLVPSQEWSILVSCSSDGTAIIWDMNRMRFLRRLMVWPLEPVLFADVHASEGHIVLGTRSRIHAFTLNGDHIASMESAAPSLETYTMSGPPRSATAADFCGGVTFFDRDFSREGPLLGIGQGQEVVLIRLRPGTSAEKPWFFQELRRLKGPEQAGDVTAVRFLGDALYVCMGGGESSGRSSLYQWSLPEGGARLLAENTCPNCMSCGKLFGILEPRRNCGGCGGVFCSADAVQPGTMLSTMSPAVHDTILLYARIDSWNDILYPTRLQLVLSQHLRFAAARLSRRLVLVIGTFLFQNGSSSWETSQAFIASLYTAATQVLNGQGKTLADIDVVVEGFCPGRNQLHGLVNHVIVTERGQEHNPYLRSLLRPESDMRVTVSPPPVIDMFDEGESPLAAASAPTSPPSRHPVVALGGTFDHLHAGHKILLTMAAHLTTRKLIIGISDDVMLKSKAHAEQLEPLNSRMKRVTAFLSLVDPDHDHAVVALQDVYGPTAVEEDIQALVLSRESIDGGRQIAELRRDRGLPALEEYVIDVISASGTELAGESDSQRLKEFKMSSTAIRRELARQTSSNRVNTGKVMKDGLSMKDLGFSLRYCPTCQATVATGMSVIGASRRSSMASLRAGSVSSRRGSVI